MCLFRIYRSQFFGVILLFQMISSFFQFCCLDLVVVVANPIIARCSANGCEYSAVAWANVTRGCRV